MRLDPGVERWDDPAFAPVLTDFKRRFKETNTEEGPVMETVLAYAMDQAYTSSRRSRTARRLSEQRAGPIAGRARVARARCHASQ